MKVKELRALVKSADDGEEAETSARLRTYAGPNDIVDKYLSDDVPTMLKNSSCVSVVMMSATWRSTFWTMQLGWLNNADVTMGGGNGDENSHHNGAVKFDMNLGDDDGKRNG